MKDRDFTQFCEEITKGKNSKIKLPLKDLQNDLKKEKKKVAKKDKEALEFENKIKKLEKKCEENEILSNMKVECEQCPSNATDPVHFNKDSLIRHLLDTHIYNRTRALEIKHKKIDELVKKDVEQEKEIKALKKKLQGIS